MVMQICPWCMKEPNAPAEVAGPTSAPRKDDECIVSTQFQVAALEEASGGFADLAPGGS
nr:hypothetical protein [Brevibacterium aurantiacum]